MAAALHKRAKLGELTLQPRRPPPRHEQPQRQRSDEEDGRIFDGRGDDRQHRQ
jgi:hypothetical protein